MKENILARADEMLTTKHMIFSAPEYRNVIRELVDLIAHQERLLVIYRDGLSSVKAELPPEFRT